MMFTTTTDPAAATEVPVFITAGPRTGQYATAVEISPLGFVTVRVREGGHIVVDPRDLRRA
jgi:hypothetical protein